MSIFSDKEEVLEGGGAGGGKTQKIRKKVRDAAPTSIWLVRGAWEPSSSLRVLQLASATPIDVEYIREDLAVATKESIDKAATEIFDYVHETDGGHKSDFTQGRLIEILCKHFGAKK